MMENYHEVLIQRNQKFVGTGHNSEIVQDEKDQDWIFYHAVSVDSPKGRVLMMDQVKWQNDWPYVEGGTPSLEAQKPFFEESTSQRIDFPANRVPNEPSSLKN